ncbi:hypothetical protein C8R43DRAFT_1177817 [Mycena crocata]|nr:hypothetical protein C8R43DRAFT_1177817 [Mycena crocata]
MHIWVSKSFWYRARASRRGSSSQVLQRRRGASDDDGAKGVPAPRGQRSRTFAESMCAEHSAETEVATTQTIRVRRAAEVLASWQNADIGDGVDERGAAVDVGSRREEPPRSSVCAPEGGGRRYLAEEQEVQSDYRSLGDDERAGRMQTSSRPDAGGRTPLRLAKRRARMILTQAGFGAIHGADDGRAGTTREGRFHGGICKGPCSGWMSEGKEGIQISDSVVH